jgi:hypothetical protein
MQLGTVRNANRILNNLSEYLHVVKDGYTSVYYLSREGRIYVGCDKIRKKGAHVDHTVMRNQMWLYLKKPVDWKNEVKLEHKKKNTYIICDALFTIGGLQHFLEVDNLQSMRKNRDKIKRYKDLMKDIALKIGHYPILVWLTTTELRRKQLEEACRVAEFPHFKVYTVRDIE